MRWIRRNYGRKQGLLRHVYHSVLARSGRYSRCGQVNWRQVRRLVFVCQGNICRSAYAEARARASGFESVSFGLGTRGGDESPPLLIQLASETGLDLAGHRSRSPASVKLENTDLVLAMEPAQLERLRDLPLGGAQVTLLGLWGRPRRPHIEDPYGMSAEYVRTCLGLIDEAVAEIVGQLDPAGARSSGLTSR